MRSIQLQMYPIDEPQTQSDTDESRVENPKWLLVAVGVCTHLGCVPLGQKDRR